MKKSVLIIIIFLSLFKFCEAQSIRNHNDTIIIEFDENNSLSIPGMPVNETELMNMLFVSYHEVQRINKIEFELSYWGIDGEIMNNFLIFDIQDYFIIHSLKYKFSRALYFSEDGSGGTWAASEEYFTDWREIKQIEPGIYKTPTYSNAEPYPVIPENAVKKAEEELKKNPMLDYTEQSGSFIIELSYSSNKKDYTKEIIFHYSQGD